MEQRQEEHFELLGMENVQKNYGQVCYSDNELLIIDQVKDLVNLKTYKIKFNVIAVCLKGRLTFDANGKPLQVQESQLFLCYRNALLGNFMISPDFEGKVLCVSDQALKQILQGQTEIWTKALYQHHIEMMDASNINMNIYTELKRRCVAKESPFRKDIIISLLRAALLGLCEELIIRTKNLENGEASGSRMETMFQAFIKNITKRKVKKARVATYAQELNITPKYLTTICHKISGKAPMDWISEYIMEDIRFYLTSTPLSCKEIASELGFPNSSFFGKYVKSHFGCSPQSFRKKNLVVPLIPTQ